MDTTVPGSKESRLTDFPDPSSSPRRLNANYGRFVGIMKLLLPTVAIILIILVFAWPQLSDQDGRFSLAPVVISPEDSENFRMLNARYTGVDRKRRPYAVTANSANQSSTDARLVKLNTPQADILLSNQSWIAITAEDGTYDRQAQILELVGNVNLFHDSGYEFHTKSAILDLMAGDAIGQEHFSGQGPFGRLSADGFRIHNQGERIELVGQSKIIMYPNRSSN
jgi:lipopolysaccharide export system protein LptC